MPELPDVELYIEALNERILNHRLVQVQIRGPFLLRSTHPPLESAFGKTVCALRRIGKQIAIGLDEDLWLVLHLKIAGRLHWKDSAAKAAKNALAFFEFDNGVLLLTEAGTQHRASLVAVQGETGLASITAGGIEPLTADLDSFSRALQSANHTLKRALTDPRIFSGIGNAYSDEILHAARLSPIAMTRKLTGEEIGRLHHATQEVLRTWIAKLREQEGGGFPKRVTAFHEGMAAHGRYGLPCARCGAKIQRIRYASNETNYCPQCQTSGKLLADRALSRLLREDWPRTPDELEALKEKAK